MNRYEFEKAVFESKLEAQAKQVLLYMAHRKNWERDTKAWPSTSTIARHTGLSESTVKRRMAVLRDTGWLAPTGGTKGRGVRVYDLHVGHADPEVVQPDTEVGQPETAEVSPGPTEEVPEQVMEDVQEEVMTGATAPVDGNPSSPKEEREGYGPSPLQESEPSALTWEERRAELEYQQFMAWERRNQREQQRQKEAAASMGADSW